MRSTARTGELAVHGSARAAELVVSLSLGESDRGDFDDTDWVHALNLAVQERCAALAWLRGRKRIDQSAPSHVRDAWRKRAIAAGRYADFQLGVLGETIGSLEREGLRPVVLKGLPLSSELYGDPAARASADLDIHVEPAEYDAAARLIAAIGWRHFEGVRPWSLTYVRDDGPFALYLEIHSSLWCWHNRHLPPLAPGMSRVAIAGVSLPAHSGPTVPVYLAAHMSKHMLPALLWFIDFRELWARSSADQQAAARAVAREARAEGYLDWALQRASALGTQRRETGLAAFGFAGMSRREKHPLLREWRSAGTTADAFRVLFAWLSPPQRRNLRDFSVTWSRRARVLLGRERARVRAYDESPDSPHSP